MPYWPPQLWIFNIYCPDCALNAYMYHFRTPSCLVSTWFGMISMIWNACFHWKHQSDVLVTSPFRCLILKSHTFIVSDMMMFGSEITHLFPFLWFDSSLGLTYALTHTFSLLPVCRKSLCLSPLLFTSRCELMWIFEVFRVRILKA